MGLTTRIQWKPHLHVQINTCNFNESKFEKNASKIYSQQIKILTLIPEHRMQTKATPSNDWAGLCGCGQ